MAGDGQKVGFRHMADFTRLANSATPRHVRHDDVGGILFNYLAKAKLGDYPLADTQWDRRIMLEPGIGLDIIGRDDLFEPHQVVGFERMGDLDRFGKIPAGMTLNTDFN